jgi:4-hydroxy-tetrahydrodipicolinate synthase
MEGCITALITPFKEGEIDEEGLIHNIHMQLEAGISGFLLLGTVGEAMTLSLKERERVVAIAVKEAKGKVPLLVGTGHNCTRSTLDFSKRAESLGADVVVVVTPYYNKPTQEGIFRHFEALSAHLSIPIMAYNNHTRSAVNIETETMVRIASLPNVIGVKEASGSLSQAGDVMHQLPHFSVFSGDDVLAMPMIALGAKGVISTVSNLVPRQMHALVKAALEERFQEARAMHYQLLPLFKAAFLEVNPVPIKTAMNWWGMPAGNCRLPLCEMSIGNREKLQQTLSQL